MEEAPGAVYPTIGFVFPGLVPLAGLMLNILGLAGVAEPYKFTISAFCGCPATKPSKAGAEVLGLTAV